MPPCVNKDNCVSKVINKTLQHVLNYDNNNKYKQNSKIWWEEEECNKILKGTEITKKYPKIEKKNLKTRAAKSEDQQLEDKTTD